MIAGDSFKISAFGKKISSADHAHHIIKGKHQRMARESLQDITQFQATLEKEICVGMSKSSAGGQIDLLQKMKATKAKYEQLLLGFKSMSDNDARNALIAYADSIQDLMLALRIKPKEH